MINEIKTDGESRMQKSIEALEAAFSKLRTGRAHPGIFIRRDGQLLWF